MQFVELIEDQFTYGGKKYGLNANRESTDVLFDRHGKNWLFGTVDKYTFRYSNLKRERDILKIATYMFIIWLKRGFHVMPKGVNDPPIDTNVEIKTRYFNKFIERVKNTDISLDFLKSSDRMKSISEELGSFSNLEWVNISEYSLIKIFRLAEAEWDLNFKNVEEHDKDTENEKQKQ